MLTNEEKVAGEGAGTSCLVTVLQVTDHTYGVGFHVSLSFLPNSF